ncbi:hypothetical protein OAF54_00650 [bacterium]|nr:hypothetical protein [bacterium]
MRPKQSHHSEADFVTRNPRMFTRSLVELCQRFLKQHGAKPEQLELPIDQPCKQVACWSSDGRSVVWVDFPLHKNQIDNSY